MTRKTIALFMLVGMISAGTLFGGQVSAKTSINGEAVKGTNVGAVRLSAASASLTPGVQPGLALVTFENYTPWTLQCFTDGQFRGLVLPMHSLSVWTGSGYTMLAARADFINATPAIWNSGGLYYYPGGNYSWRLVP
jgi:hypothetical protein